MEMTVIAKQISFSSLAATTVVIAISVDNICLLLIDEWLYFNSYFLYNVLYLCKIILVIMKMTYYISLIL